MNEQMFIAYLRASKKPDRIISDYQNLVRVFEDFLKSHHRQNDLDQASPEDLQAFTTWGKATQKNVYRILAVVKAYYTAIQSEHLAYTACELGESVQNDTRRLGEFPKVDQGCVKKLSGIGISTVNQFLQLDQEPDSLKRLANEIDVPEDSVLELVKLANLSRLPGLKKVRGRLFYEAGLDTLSKIAAMQPEQVCRLLEDYIQDTGYEGATPTLSEAQYTVKIAAFMAHRPKEM